MHSGSGMPFCSTFAALTAGHGTFPGIRIVLIVTHRRFFCKEDASDFRNI